VVIPTGVCRAALDYHSTGGRRAIIHLEDVGLSWKIKLSFNATTPIGLASSRLDDEQMAVYFAKLVLLQRYNIPSGDELSLPGLRAIKAEYDTQGHYIAFFVLDNPPDVESSVKSSLTIVPADQNKKNDNNTLASNTPTTNLSTAISLDGPLNRKSYWFDKIANEKTMLVQEFSSKPTQGADLKNSDAAKYESDKRIQSCFQEISNSISSDQELLSIEKKEIVQKIDAAKAELLTMLKSLSE